MSDGEQTQDVGQNTFSGSEGAAFSISVEDTDTGAPSGALEFPVTPQATEVSFVAPASGTPQAPLQSTVPVFQSNSENAVFQAAKKGIDARTAGIDTRSKEKEKQLTEAAQAYLKEQNEIRAKKIQEIKEKHVKDQERQEKEQTCPDERAVWVNVGKMVCFNKVNKYSKNTERMRGILGKLSQPGSA